MLPVNLGKFGKNLPSIWWHTILHIQTPKGSRLKQHVSSSVSGGGGYKYVESTWKSSLYLQGNRVNSHGQYKGLDLNARLCHLSTGYKWLNQLLNLCFKIVMVEVDRYMHTNSTIRLTDACTQTWTDERKFGHALIIMFRKDKKLFSTSKHLYQKWNTCKTIQNKQGIWRHRIFNQKILIDTEGNSDACLRRFEL